tara:strand:+ start:62 stop:940 length:879 start_codon:yes stop_codon:yes gene_type:complete
MQRLLDKLVIGTAQFGQDYGVTNKAGQVSKEETLSIIKKARIHNVTSLDTASAYGSSEYILGNIGVDGLTITTKLPSIGSLESGFTEFYKKSLKSSLNNLKASSVNTILLHRPEELTGKYGKFIYEALYNLKIQGYTKNIGISIYSPDILPSIIDNYQLDSVQVPINIFDRRIIDSGWLKKLSDLNISIIARSVFLQGILLSKFTDLPSYFNTWIPHFRSWDSFCVQNQLSPLEACLHFVAQISEIDKIIVGIESETQFSEILEALDKSLDLNIDHLGINDINLINPIHWQL